MFSGGPVNILKIGTSTPFTSIPIVISESVLSLGTGFTLTSIVAKMDLAVDHESSSSSTFNNAAKLNVSLTIPSFWKVIPDYLTSGTTLLIIS